MSNQNESLWTGRFIMLILLTLCSGAAGQLTVPLVASYAKNLGADLATAGTVAGLMSLMGLFICPFAGVLSDIFNRKRILQVTSICYGIMLVLHAFANSVGMLTVLRILTGIFFSINSVTVIAFSTSFIPRERMGEGLGYTALATILAQAVGPGVGMWLVDKSGYGASFIAAGISLFACFAVITLLPYQEEKKDPAQRRKIKMSNLFAFEFVGWMLLAMLFSAGNGLVSTFIKLIAEERGIANIALFFTVYSAFMVILRPATGKLLDRKGVYFLMIPAIIFAALGMVFIGLGYSLAFMLIASACKALGQGAGVPTLQADCIKSLDKSRAGVATSTIQIGQHLGNALAPMIGGVLAERMGYEPMFVGYGGVILVLGFLILFLHYRKDKAKKAVA